MSVLKDEIRAIQNPALGAFLQWKYSITYSENHSQAENSPAILLFVILPILFHQDTFSLLSSTRKKSGLAKFVTKFTDAEQGKSDILLSVHDRAIEMRDLSLHSLQIGIYNKLFILDTDSGRIFPFRDVSPFKTIPIDMEKMGKEAEKLGLWFSQLSLTEISNFLKVAF